MSDLSDWLSILEDARQKFVEARDAAVAAPDDEQAYDEYVRRLTIMYQIEDHVKHRCVTVN